MQFSITAILTFTVGMFLLVASVILSGAVNRFFKSRISAVVAGIIGLLIFFIGKYMFYIMDYVNNAPPPMLPSGSMDEVAWKAIVKARLFLIYIPDILLLLLSAGLVFDKTKNFAKVIAPYGLYFGVVYLTFSSFSCSQFSYAEYLVSSGAWYKFVFECDGILRMGSVGFIYLIVVSTWTLIACKEFSRWSILSCLLISVPMFLYTFEMQLLPEFNVGANAMTPYAFIGLTGGPNCLTNWTGHKYFPNYFSLLQNIAIVNPDTNIVLGDVTGYQYLSTYGSSALTSYAMTFTYLIPIAGTYLTVMLTCIFKNIFTRDIRRVNYIYKPWYYQSRLFYNVCSAVDARINDWLTQHFNTPYLYGLLEKDMKKLSAYAKYLQSQKAPSYIDPKKLSEVVQKLEDKQNSKNAKKKSKENKNKIERIERELSREDRNQPNQTSSIQPLDEIQVQPVQQQIATMTQEWTDESGVNWGIDQSGNYFYKQNGQWVAYVAA